jgi:hypothetical protein
LANRGERDEERDEERGHPASAFHTSGLEGGRSIRLEAFVLGGLGLSERRHESQAAARRLHQSAGRGVG